MIICDSSTKYKSPFDVFESVGDILGIKEGRVLHRRPGVQDPHHIDHQNGVLTQPHSGPMMEGGCPVLGVAPRGVGHASKRALCPSILSLIGHYFNIFYGCLSLFTLLKHSPFILKRF